MNKLIPAVILALVLLIGIASVGSTSYIHANGKLIAKINESGNISYYHSDHLGSTSIITNSDGKVVEDQKNLPFGELIQGNEKYGFTGKEFNSDLNLNYFGARYYSPEVGRFLTVDPAMQDFSSYAYTGNNPLTRIDPDGMWWWKTHQQEEEKVVDFSEEKKPYLEKIIKESDERVGLLIHPFSAEKRLKLNARLDELERSISEIRGLNDEPYQPDREGLDDDPYYGHSIEDYQSYLDGLAQFLRQADYPIYIFAESRKMKKVKKWLKEKEITPQRLIILVPTYYCNPTPNLRRFKIFSRITIEWDVKSYKPWRKVLGDLGIKKIILGGETAQGVKIDKEGNVINGGKWCIGSTYEILKEKFKLIAGKGLFFPPQ